MLRELSVIERLRKRINAAGWKPGQAKSLDDEILEILMDYSRRIERLEQRESDAMWSTTRWGQ